MNLLLPIALKPSEDRDRCFEDGLRILRVFDLLLRDNVEPVHERRQRRQMVGEPFEGVTVARTEWGRWGGDRHDTVSSGTRLSTSNNCPMYSDMIAPQVGLWQWLADYV
jgi:hypothetical protein